MKQLFLFLFIFLSTALLAQDLVINEYMSDPYHESITPVETWDTNGDGYKDSDDDEFVEIVNNSGGTLDISGYTCADGAKTRHTFASGTVLSAGQSIVIFGAGVPTGIPGLAVVADSGAIGLNNGGDTFTIKDAGGTVVTSITIAADADDEAWARDPDITGDFVAHSSISSGVYYSPGKDNTDGTNFPENTISLVINEILADPASDDSGTPEVEGDANGDGTRSYWEDEFIEIVNKSGSSMDISGYTVSDKSAIRHTFAASTTLADGESIVVFGGGTPTDIPGQDVVASSGKLDFDNAGDNVYLRDASGTIIQMFAYGKNDGSYTVGAYNASTARQPDFTGSFAKHGNSEDYSPGKKNSDNSALPVELTLFTVNVTEGGVILNWSTATEVNNYGFEVEKNNGQKWETIGFVEGHGNSSSANDYMFIDNNILGKASYRLKQLDNNGNYEYSEVVEVESQLPKEYKLLQNYPNPFNPTTVISYTIPQASDVSLRIYNSLGQEVASLVNEHQEAGKFNIVFNASSLPSGIYFYSITADKYSSVKKLMLLK